MVQKVFKDEWWFPGRSLVVAPMTPEEHFKRAEENLKMKKASDEEKAWKTRDKQKK